MNFSPLNFRLFKINFRRASQTTFRHQAYLLGATLLVMCLAACAPNGGRQASADGASFTELTAHYVELAQINLTWKSAAEVSGAFVEFDMNDTGSFTILAITPADTTTAFQHPEVAPETRYSYRIVPFFGGATQAVEINTGKPVETSTATFNEEGPLEESASTQSNNPTVSLRTTSGLTAAPVGLTATLVAPTTVDLRWEDRANDEDGFLVEISTQPNEEFEVCALLEPNITSFRKAFLPPETRCYFRVRAFVFGKPSEVVCVQTPLPPGVRQHENPAE